MTTQSDTDQVKGTEKAREGLASLKAFVEWWEANQEVPYFCAPDQPVRFSPRMVSSKELLAVVRQLQRMGSQSR